MITLVSDLHLSDDPARSTINVPRLLEHLTLVINGARRKGVRRLTLVLLGDIFEILRSEVWVNREIRPWEDCTPAHVSAVADIIKRIAAANDTFFAGLAGLLREHDGFLRLAYIPGNHDRPLATAMGAEGRVLLLDKLPALNAEDGKTPARPSDALPDRLVDEEHELIAQHGHEFDRANRYEEGAVAVGDAVVIEFVQRLPMRVRQGLQLDEADRESLDFLDEMDNVRPHSLKALTDWIDANLAGKDKIRPRVLAEIEKSLGETLAELLSLKERVTFASFEGVERRVSIMLRALKGLQARAGSRALARLLPEDSAAPPYPDFALDTLQVSRSLGGNFRYFVCGHTHDPMVVPLDLGPRRDDRVRYYLNTGTWRRVHRIAGGLTQSGQIKAFSCQEEGCVVNIYSPSDRGVGCPPFEFQRFRVGANT